MKIDSKDIVKEGITTLGVEELPDIIDIDEQGVKFEDPVSIKLTVQVVNETVLIQGFLKTKVAYECSRCLRVFKQAIEVENFSFNCDYEEGASIDLTEPIREDIIIRLSLKPLCVENCKGLCRKCGVNLNVTNCSCREEKKPEPSKVEQSNNVFEQLNFDKGKIAVKK